MKIVPRLTIVGLIGAVFAGTLAAAPDTTSNDIMRLDGAPVLSAKAAPLIAWRAAVSASTADTSASLTFPPLISTKLNALQEQNAQSMLKRIKIGVNRNVDTEADNALPDPVWQTSDNGYVTRFNVTSAGASALRLALHIQAMPDNAELRFAGSDNPERILGVIRGEEINQLRDSSKTYWTPATDGATQTVEIYLPSTASPKSVRFSVITASHLFTSASDSYDTRKVLKASEACEVDVACKFSSLGSNYQNATTAVARMVFSDTTGTYTCTGTLLNNSAQDQTPYFWSAAHCISTQAAASTLNTFWFDQAASCSSSGRNTNYQQLTGGAALLHVNAAADTLLLRLNNSAPGSAYLAGWDASKFSSGNMIGIHHPHGDIKKVSTGSGQGKSCSAYPIDADINTGNLSLVSWSEGITEQGSSGSGLFTQSSGSYYLRGGLTGGQSSCSTTGGSVASGNVDCYSRLDLVYSDIKQYLSPSSKPVLTREYGGQWVSPSKSAWGLTVVQFTPQQYLFVPWYTYDSSGKATWYVFEGNNLIANDSLSADVSRYTGSAWGTKPYDNSKIVQTKAGTAKLTFTSATTAKFEYNVDGVSESLDLVKLQ